ncbi:hypothetical protein GCM10027168_31570 [Streptomyces capparidis]
MSASPLSLPPEHVPEGTRAWSSRDVHRWLACVPARWAHPAWAVLALLAAGLWATASVGGPACTDADPCGAQWWGTVLMGAALLQLYWVWRLPGPALALLGPLTAGVLLSEEAVGTASGTARIAVLAAAAFTGCGLLERLAVTARQRALAEEAAGPARHPLPAPAAAFRRGGCSVVLAVPLLAVAAWAGWQGLADLAADRDRAERAQRVQARVTGGNEDGVEVALPGGTRTLDVLDPGAHPVGSTIGVLVDGAWARPAAEPHDASGWQVVLLVAGLPGLALLGNGLDGRRRSRRLRAAPLPALRVLVREGHEDGRTWVFAADDRAAARPVLSVNTLFAAEDDGEEEWAPGEDDAEEPDAELPALRQELTAILKGTTPRPPLREAVMYGAPWSGAEVVFVSRQEPDGEQPEVECGVSPVRPARPGGGGPERGPRLRSAGETAAEMVPGDRPRSWSAGPVSRTVALMLLLVEGGGTFLLLSGASRWWYWLLEALALPWLVKAIAAAANWRVTADRDGLWIAGAWRVRRVPWEELTGVARGFDELVFTTRSGRVRLGPTGWVWLERRLGRVSPDLRAVEELRALLHHPGLRPTRQAGPGEQGAPLGPAAVAVTVLWAVAVLLLL